MIELLDDEDEVLLGLAESFGNLVDCVGGTQFLSTLIPPLEKLCFIEESTVRDMVRIRNYNKFSGVK
jgi:serine/threonine-protein phosphatase 2A regulatory subunit A